MRFMIIYDNNNNKSISISCNGLISWLSNAIHVIITNQNDVMADAKAKENWFVLHMLELLCFPTAKTLHVEPLLYTVQFFLII